MGDWLGSYSRRSNFQNGSSSIKQALRAAILSLLLRPSFSLACPASSASRNAACRATNEPRSSLFFSFPVVVVIVVVLFVSYPRRARGISRLQSLLERGYCAKGNHNPAKVPPFLSPRRDSFLLGFFAHPK